MLQTLYEWKYLNHIIRVPFSFDFNFHYYNDSMLESLAGTKDVPHWYFQSVEKDAIPMPLMHCLGQLIEGYYQLSLENEHRNATVQVMLWDNAEGTVHFPTRTLTRNKGGHSWYA